jgi:hypothetical protein
MKKILFLGAALLAVPVVSEAAIVKRGEAIIVSQPNYSITFSARNGSILSATQKGQTRSICRSGEDGLWRVRLRDNAVINAAEFSAAAKTKRSQRTLMPKLMSLN